MTSFQLLFFCCSLAKVKLECAYTFLPEEKKGYKEPVPGELCVCSADSSGDVMSSNGDSMPPVGTIAFVPAAAEDTIEEEPQTSVASEDKRESQEDKLTQTRSGYKKMTCKKPEKLTAEEIAGKIAEGMRRRAAEKKRNKARCSMTSRVCCMPMKKGRK